MTVPVAVPARAVREAEPAVGRGAATVAVVPEVHRLLVGLSQCDVSNCPNMRPVTLNGGASMPA